MTCGSRHPKTEAIVLSYLAGKTHKEVAREHGAPYSTCAEIARRYINWVPVLKRPLRKKSTGAPEVLQLPLDDVRKQAYTACVDGVLAKG